MCRSQLTRRPSCSGRARMGRPDAGGCATCSTVCARAAANSSAATARRSRLRPGPRSTRDSSNATRRPFRLPMRRPAPGSLAARSPATPASYCRRTVTSRGRRRRASAFGAAVSSSSTCSSTTPRSAAISTRRSACSTVAIAAEPLDEDRHMRAAELLLFQGRRGSARSLVERAATIRDELGLELSPRLERLRAATSGARRRGVRPLNSPPGSATAAGVRPGVRPLKAPGVRRRQVRPLNSPRGSVTLTVGRSLDGPWRPSLCARHLGSSPRARAPRRRRVRRRGRARRARRADSRSRALRSRSLRPARRCRRADPR